MPSLTLLIYMSYDYLLLTCSTMFCRYLGCLEEVFFSEVLKVKRIEY
jgi:hypothetical protein